MHILMQRFEQKTKHHLVASFAATGQLYTQIKHNAPFEILLSADKKTPSKLVSQGDAVEGSQFTYAKGVLVLWSAKNTCPQPLEEVLKNDQFNRLAVADARLAPYGLAAKQALQIMHLDTTTTSKVVTGQSIGQTLQFIATGNADIGFVALSQVPLKDVAANHCLWRVPSNYYKPIKQDAVLLNKGENDPIAIAFLKYIKSDEANAIIARYGYLP
ncbi:UNVERIFIED_CONTAM: hypothetical protein GTU68_035415 [Idotea baltica]|nr:hypothetical protein [Idotea baltica]